MCSAGRPDFCRISVSESEQMPAAPAYRNEQPHRRPWRRGAFGLTAACLATLAAAGCQSLGSTNPLALWKMGLDSSLSKAPTEKETGDNRNLLARMIKPKAPPAGEVDTPNLVLGSDGWRPMKPTKDPVAEKEMQAAETLFQQNKLADAQTAFAKIAKDRKGSIYGEKAQYYLAETQFQAKKYVAAHDSFEQLMKDYRGTEFVDKVVKREYEIAQIWLAQSDPKVPADKKLGRLTHFTGEQPWLDTHGHALRALEHVRQHNPNGELSDDAVLRIADEYMASGDYDSAAIHYKQLVADHPKSPFVQRAQLALIDTRMKAYMGPEYNEGGLDEAAETVKQTMAMFPDRPAGNEKLYSVLDHIQDQKAERTYVIGEYYRRAGYPASAEYYFAKIPRRWPKSPWAVKAKTQLASLAKVPRVRHDPSRIMTTPGSNDPMLGGMGGGGMGMGGMGMGGMGMGMPGGMGGAGGMQ
jgi:TolA-binding protein